MDWLTAARNSSSASYIVAKANCRRSPVILDSPPRNLLLRARFQTDRRLVGSCVLFVVADAAKLSVSVREGHPSLNSPLQEDLRLVDVQLLPGGEQLLAVLPGLGPPVEVAVQAAEGAVVPRRAVRRVEVEDKLLHVLLGRLDAESCLDDPGGLLIGELVRDEALVARGELRQPARPRLGARLNGRQQRRVLRFVEAEERGCLGLQAMPPVGDEDPFNRATQPQGSPRASGARSPDRPTNLYTPHLTIRCARVRAMQYLMKPAMLSWLFGRMHTASGLKMALPQSGTTRFVPGSSRNSFYDSEQGGIDDGHRSVSSALGGGTLKSDATRTCALNKHNHPHEEALAPAARAWSAGSGTAARG